MVRGAQWNLTKYIGRRRLPRGLICIRFEDLTDFNCSSFWRFDKIEPKSVRYEVLIRIYRELIVSWLLKKLIFYEIFDRNLVVYLVTKWYSPINDPLYYMIKYIDYNNWYQLHGLLLLVLMPRPMWTRKIEILVEQAKPFNLSLRTRLSLGRIRSKIIT